MLGGVPGHIDINQTGYIVFADGQKVRGQCNNEHLTVVITSENTVPGSLSVSHLMPVAPQGPLGLISDSVLH